jgi:hypothetical protein
MSIIFMHIPRTAGNTVSHILSNKFSTTKVSSTKLPETLNEAVWGHFRFDGREGQWMTFLREPYNRLTSLYALMRELDPFLTPTNYFNIIGSNPMCKQLNAETSEQAIDNLSRFWFVGEFLVDIPKFCNLIGFQGNIRQTHKSKFKPDLSIPDDFFTEDVKVWDHFLKTKK